MTEELKKQIRAIDLCLLAARKRQSKRTGFIHDEETIPLYQNFCFVLALFRQKTSELCQEGKELLQRLLAFQTPSGNFPLFLHDYPKCWDGELPLKIAPILVHLLREFGFFLQEDVKTALNKLLSFAASRPRSSPFWENRFRALSNQPLFPMETSLFTAAEWTEWLITAGLCGQSTFSIPYNASLQAFVGSTPNDVQEGEEPQPHPVEWLLAEGNYSPRLIQDHPSQLFLAPLFPIQSSSCQEAISFTKTPSFRLLWKGKTLHSLVGPGLLVELPEVVEWGRSDLFEVAFFTNLSSEKEILIEGRKASTFQLGEKILIQTPNQSVSMQFDLIEGEGEFFGHLSRANRKTQIRNEVYDWQIALRTLRRKEKCLIQVTVAF